MRGDKHGAPIASVVDRATVERTWLLARANMGALRARGPERSFHARDCCECEQKCFFKRHKPQRRYRKHQAKHQVNFSNALRRHPEIHTSLSSKCN